ncbi:putative ABC transporter, ATP-binding protein YheS [Bordetella hinzii CA90 BAL1384]|nr:putative ABC transporter, ATP-binding protein YheS [Bordetella hinzii CA90 BAL1384]
MTLRRGTKVLLDGAEFVVNPGERVGFVGKNGAGKSSLFALLTGALDQDAGSLDVPAGWRIASVQQEIAADDKPAREFVIDGDTHLRALQAERAGLGDDQGTRIAELEAALAEAGVWSANSRAEQLLAGLGFAPDEWMKPVASFSGGWRMRLTLARALMAPSELLLLDEPTNHLDLDAMLWLEKWLAAYPGTVLLISHDTEFLDAVARVILHFDHGKLIRYRGGYEDFLTQRAERLRQASIAHERQARETARLQGFIDRFKAKASKAKQAQSRVKALARMQTLAPLHAEAGIDIRIPSPEHTPDPLLVLDKMAAGYTDASGQPVGPAAGPGQNGGRLYRCQRPACLHPAQCDSHGPGGRTGGRAGRQRGGQKHAHQDAGRGTALAVGRTPCLARAGDRLLPPASAGHAGPGRHAAAAPGAPGARYARARAAQLPGRFRFFGRHRQRQGGPHVRRREGAPCPLPHRLAETESAAAG